MTVDEIKEQIIEEFSLFDDWMDRYDYLIEQGKELQPIDEKYKTDDYLIKGCQSQVWLHAFLNEENKVVFKADSDAIITKGMIALLIRVFSDQEPEAIEKADISFLDKIGLREQLSPTRSNGLHSMVKQMKYYAIAFNSKLS
jgi:cysteine desulfuration protein SufE